MLMPMNELIKGMETMELFKYLDEQYAADRTKYEIQQGNNGFESYLSIEPLDFDAKGRIRVYEGISKDQDTLYT